MNGYSANQIKIAAEIAASRIANGTSPSGLVHVLHFPRDDPRSRDDIQGLSSTITPAEYARGGYSEVYYSLDYIVGCGEVIAAAEAAMRPICEIAREISREWKNPNFAAVPYLRAMRELRTVEDMYIHERADDIVLRFLCNAGSFRGAKARALKAELRKHLA